MERIGCCILVMLVVTHVSSELKVSQIEELKEEIRDQRVSIVQNQEQLKQMLELLGKIQQEMRKHREEVANDRLQVAKWHAETYATITAIRIDTANRQKNVFEALNAGRAKQEQIQKLLITIEQEVRQQKQDEATDRNEFSKWRTEYQEVIAYILKFQEHDASQKPTDVKSQFPIEQAEPKRNQTSKTNIIKQGDHESKETYNVLLFFYKGPYQSCGKALVSTSGKYSISAKETSATFFAYCEEEKFGGGWMVIQHRFDGSLSFNRNWTEYRNGFGDVEGEHWLGLEKVYQFTKEQDYELLVEMKDFHNNSKYAKYSSFGIGSEAEQYRLTSLGTHSGTAGDALTYHKGIQFSTPDRDNDKGDEGNCAMEWEGGWWFHECYDAFLNGLYQNVSDMGLQKIAWYDFADDFRGLSYSRMMIRPVN